MSTVLIIIIGAALAFVSTYRGLTLREMRYARLGLLLHFISAFAQSFLQDRFYEGTSDDNGYLRTGALIARLLDANFLRFAPEIIRMVFHLESTAPISIYGTASSQTMESLAGFHVYLFGPELVNACLVAGVVVWFGQLCLYRAGRRVFGESERPAVLVGCMLVPSAVFWGSAFEKEALVLAASGVLAWSIHAATKAPNVVNIGGVVIGATLIGLLKPYVLFPYFLAVNAWLYVQWSARQSRRVAIRPRYVVLALIVAFGTVVVLGRIFPQFGVDHLSETVARQQGAWQYAQGGSNLDGDTSERIGLAQQIPLVPLALVNALFRPALFEARNITMLAAALETTAVTVAIVVLIVRHPWRETLEAIFVSPPLAFAVTFVLVLSIPVGLTTRNLGTLSRYRVPMMPFLVTALLVLLRRAKQRRAEAAMTAKSKA